MGVYLQFPTILEDLDMLKQLEVGYVYIITLSYYPSARMRSKGYGSYTCCLYLIASEASFLVSSMARIFYIYLFQAVRRAVNVLNVSTCI